MIGRSAMLRGVAVIGLATGLSACSMLGGSTPLETFDFSPPAASARAAAGRQLQVLVPDPIADKALDGDRIVVRSADNEIANYAGAQWADRLPRLIQSRLVATLDASGRVRAAMRPGLGVASDRQALLEIRSFEYRSAEKVVVAALALKVMDDRSGRILAAADLRGTEPVGADTAVAVTAAFDRLLARLLAEAVPTITR
ncbi:hypothetical protein EYW49_08055 [Siculibacillus lacustris]|uniref:ABC-type transport auxiliary lipoprotein component domain-containing protein n=1 Tax=Siculibacillus lacustris TaxID=1549641 RepID=A0A4Q9VRS3_9HYPH|nr:ABC-type transport auxiliary lipoprotein family protein [Siculibacillus lacustris]TBW38644.1 hypothetical protein EYW49_08055 [Siculibacillus lacustris]